jgi:sulfur relay (sulfurtransferase) DsrF/TusC family protein
MARVIMGDQQLPAKVVYVGSAMDVWIVDDIYRLFVGDHSLNVTDLEAAELAVDIKNLDPQALEQKWLAIANEFLSSLQ